MQSFSRLRSVDSGFQPENVLTVRLALGGSQYMEPARVVGFYDELLGRVQQIPGVASVAAASDTTVGVYGVIAYTVSQSTRELGIRMALGARSIDVLRLVLRQVTTLVLLGIAIGVAAALVLSRTVSGMLYGTSPTDPATYIGIALLLSATALLASYLPARQATRVDPMIALRTD